jgi:hypothetical protein
MVTIRVFIDIVENSITRGHHLSSESEISRAMDMAVDYVKANLSVDPFRPYEDHYSLLDAKEFVSLSIYKRRPRN